MTFVMTEKIKAIKHILATIFADQNALRSLTPEFKWSGFRNLIRDYGESVAIDYYGFIKADPGTSLDFSFDEEIERLLVKIKAKKLLEEKKLLLIKDMFNYWLWLKHLKS